MAGSSIPGALGWPGWQFAMGVYLATVGLACFLSFGLPPLLGQHQWFMSGDVWWTTQSAQWVSHGAVGSVYEANPWYSALPGYLMLYAPVTAFGDHLGLVAAIPIPLPHPSMWLLAGPFFFVTGSSCVLGIDHLAATLGVPKVRRRALLVILAILIVAPTPGLAGHPEDILATGLLCVSISQYLRQEWARAAYVLAVAVMIQTWAGLAIPILVLASPVGQRARMLMRSSALPGFTAVLLILLDPRPAIADLLKQPMVGSGQRLPWWYIAGHTTVVDGWRTVPAVVGSSSRWLAVVSAFLVALVVRRSTARHAVLAAVAFAMLARGLFETEFWNYYFAPAAVLLVLLVAVGTPGRRLLWTAGTVLGMVPAVCWPLAYEGISINAYLAEAVLLASGLAALGIGIQDRRASTGQDEAVVGCSASEIPGLPAVAALA